MRIICLQENLVTGLLAVSRAVATKGGLPILSHVLLETSSGRLKLTATDLETSVVTWVGVKAEEEGSIAVPAKILIDLVRSLPGGQLTLSSDESQILSINTDDNSFRINGVGSKEFPSLPQIKGDISFEVKDPEVFSSALSQVVFASARDEGRPVLTGVLVLVSADGLVLAATDGFRLSEKKMGSIGKEIESLSVVVPTKALSEVGRLVSKSNQPLKIEVASRENQIVFRSEDLEIYSRLIEGGFPDYQNIVPSGFETTVVLETSELLRAVRLVSVFATGGSNVVRIKVNSASGGLELSADTQEVGEGKTNLPAKVTGSDVEIAFNAQYLIDCLNNLDSDQVEFLLSEPLKPAMFRPPKSSNYLHVIMPVRVQG